MSLNSRRRQRGQVLPLFAFLLIAVMAMAALLIDGGLAWSNRRQAQAAADTAALAAARAAVGGATADELVAAARAIALANGYATDLIDCDGVTQAGQGVVVNRPPTTGAFAGDANYIEVITTRAMRTTFAATVGQSCWLVSARAVAVVASVAVAGCSFCSLNDTNKGHTLILKNGATLRIDGDIYTNSSNGYPKEFNADGTCTPGNGTNKDGTPKNPFYVCGDGFDVFGDGGQISARTISVVGGWETHDQNIAFADYLAQINGAACPNHPNAPGQARPTNICIRMPPMDDPLTDIPAPNLASTAIPVANVGGCPATAMTPTGTAHHGVNMLITGLATICPGAYYGGIRITGTANVTMLPGIYLMGGGGFVVIGSASVDGSGGVMIYNSSGTALYNTYNPGVDLVPPPVAGNAATKLNKGLESLPKDKGNTGQAVTFTMTIDKKVAGGPAITGAVKFYDGLDPIPGCGAVPVVTAGGTKVKASCTTTYPDPGTRFISAVYLGDASYNGIGDAMSYTVLVPAALSAGAVNIATTGNVRLSGPTSGRYSGLTIFQARDSDEQITLSMGSGLAACTGSWLTDGVPPNATPVPDPCGPLGGMQGTIYAADDDALVLVTASGLANMQIISGMLQIDSDADARFAYKPSVFANGNVRLVE